MMLLVAMFATTAVKAQVAYESVAKRMTEDMVDKYGLDKKQAKKLATINEAYTKELFSLVNQRDQNNQRGQGMRQGGERGQWGGGQRGQRPEWNGQRGGQRPEGGQMRQGGDRRQLVGNDSLRAQRMRRPMMGDSLAFQRMGRMPNDSLRAQRMREMPNDSVRVAWRSQRGQGMQRGGQMRPGGQRMGQVGAEGRQRFNQNSADTEQKAKELKEKYEAQLKEVLSEDQYTRYQQDVQRRAVKK